MQPILSIFPHACLKITGAKDGMIGPSVGNQNARNHASDIPKEIAIPLLAVHPVVWVHPVELADDW